MKASESPSLPHVLNNAIKSALLNLHTAMPAIVQSYDANTQRADCQPVCKRRYADDTVVDLPLIPNVPVCMPRTLTSWINLPIKTGDTVLLVFAERSLEQWRLQGTIVDPDDTRHHDLSDAIAIPGVFDETKPFLGNAENLEIVNALTKFSLAPDGSFEIGNETTKITADATGNIILSNAAGSLELDPTGKVKLGSSAADLLDLFDQLIDALTSATTATALGPQPLVQPLFATIKASLALIKGA